MFPSAKFIISQLFSLSSGFHKKFQSLTDLTQTISRKASAPSGAAWADRAGRCALQPALRRRANGCLWGRSRFIFFFCSLFFLFSVYLFSVYLFRSNESSSSNRLAWAVSRRRFCVRNYLLILVRCFLSTIGMFSLLMFNVLCVKILRSYFAFVDAGRVLIIFFV